MSAMSRSRMPQKTKFAYTRSPEAVAHQPVPAKARIALNASKPATINIMTAAKVNMPGLRVTAPPERSMGSLAPPGIGSLCCAIVYPFFSLLGITLRRSPFPFLSRQEGDEEGGKGRRERNGKGDRRSVIPKRLKKG